MEKVSADEIEELRLHCQEMTIAFYVKTHEKGLGMTAANAMLINTLCQSFVKVKGKDVFLEMLMAILADMDIKAIAGKVVKGAEIVDLGEKGGTVH